MVNITYIFTWGLQSLSSLLAQSYHDLALIALALDL